MHHRGAGAAAGRELFGPARRVTPTVNPVSGEGVDSGGLVKRRPPSGDLHDTGLTRTGYTGSA
jgi:hypothetical protein